MMCAILCLAGGCDSVVSEPEAPVTKTAVEIPEAQCKAVDKTLKDLADNNGLVFKSDGTAMVEQAVWYASFSAAHRTTIPTLLAVHSSCSAPSPLAEVQVTVTNEMGVIITRESVELTERGLQALASRPKS
ncbi:MAG: hypothetical protein H0W74_04815 [Sphingosinicella sp.]|nr:hypothetical protein [Sphingosinicella sp.]